ncbi:MAG: putative hydro-lyase [Chloroflexota bacterium]|nr:putative hydro-lyase [Chloroflexota bacterium]
MTTVTEVTLRPREIRNLIRSGKFERPTAGVAPGHVQANLAILPKELSFDFLLFCQRNPKPCPLIEVLEPGQIEVFTTAPKSDIRTDIPLYRVYENGEFTSEISDLQEVWKEDFVSFLLGCSFSFESALITNGIKLPHFENGTNVSMYITNIPTVPAGPFSGPMVVSMRSIPQEKVVRAVQVTSRFPGVHGSPIHIGDPLAIGIHDISKPDFGEPTTIKEGEVPVFWACGVTPQSVAMSSKPPIMITHAPGHMFITDMKDEDYSVL